MDGSKFLFPGGAEAKAEQVPDIEEYISNSMVHMNHPGTQSATVIQEIAEGSEIVHF